MENETNNLNDWIPESEKISIVDEALKIPGCPIPPEVIRSLTRELKLDLFDKLVEGDAIKYTPHQQKTQANIGNLAFEENSPDQSDDQTVQAHQDYTTLYSIIGTDLKEDIDIAISQKARQQGLYIIGANGTGKSTLLANIILSEISLGCGVCLIEPHTDLINTILAGIPDYRLKDVIYLNVEDVDFPFDLNIYECPHPRTIRNMAATASFVSHVFERVWDAGTDTPRLMQNLRAVTRTLIENPGTTFSEIPLLFSSDTVRANMLANLTNSSIVSFWEDYERKSQRDRDIYIESTMNKVNAFLDEPMIRNIAGQGEATIHFRRIMDSGKILLVKLSPQFEEASLLIGAIIIGQLLMAAFSRTDTPEENRRQFNLTVDEFQKFATEDFSVLISEARKFRIATTLSHQTLAQLPESNKAAAIAAGNLIVFRVSGEDAKALAKNFDTTPTKEIIGEEPIRAPVSGVISHLVKRGHNDPRVTRFAQVYLQNLEDLIHKITQYEYCRVYSNYFPELLVHNCDIRKGRELLNESLYRCMVEKTTQRLIPSLALYILAVAQPDESEEVFFRYINYSGWILPPHNFKGFKKGAEIFGDPNFIHKDSVAKFIGSSSLKRARNAAAAAVKMITELRYTMDTLAQYPILIDTGQYQPKYQNRTYADMENEISRDLTQQPNFQAKVKLLAGEHVIQTKNSPSGLTGSQLAERIAQIQAQTRKNYCKPRLEVEKEIRARQEKWRYGCHETKTNEPQPRHGRAADEPPPTHY